MTDDGTTDDGTDGPPAESDPATGSRTAETTDAGVGSHSDRRRDLLVRPYDWMRSPEQTDNGHYQSPSTE